MPAIREHVLARQPRDDRAIHGFLHGRHNPALHALQLQYCFIGIQDLQHAYGQVGAQEHSEGVGGLAQVDLVAYELLGTLQFRAYEQVAADVDVIQNVGRPRRGLYEHDLLEVGELDAEVARDDGRRGDDGHAEPADDERDDVERHGDALVLPPRERGGEQQQHADRQQHAHDRRQPERDVSEVPQLCGELANVGDGAPEPVARSRQRTHELGHVEAGDAAGHDVVRAHDEVLYDLERGHALRDDGRAGGVGEVNNVQEARVEEVVGHERKAHEVDRRREQQQPARDARKPRGA